MSGEQFMYESFADLFGVFQADHIAKEFGWNVKLRT